MGDTPVGKGPQRTRQVKQQPAPGNEKPGASYEETTAMVGNSVTPQHVDAPALLVQLEQLVNHIVCVPYAHEYRLVLVADVRVTKDGNVLLVGLDEDRNEFRSFRVDRIPKKHTIKVVK